MEAGAKFATRVKSFIVEGAAFISFSE